MTAASIAAHLYRTVEEIESLIRAFESCTLSRSEWTHAAHLTVALWYLLRDTRAEATRRIRDRIKRFNADHGIQQMKTGGYHETLTLFWIHIVSHYLSNEVHMDSTLDALTGGLIETCGDARLPFEYYTRERLFSPEARSSWVEPDLKPLPD